MVSTSKYQQRDGQVPPHLSEGVEGCSTGAAPACAAFRGSEQLPAGRLLDTCRLLDQVCFFTRGESQWKMEGCK